MKGNNKVTCYQNQGKREVYASVVWFGVG